MGWSFRESIKILPGIRLNFSRRGVSASVGPRGLHLGIGGGRPPRVTGGIGPLHYYQSFGSRRVEHHPATPVRRRRTHFRLLTLLVVGFAAWFGWKSLSPEWKSALLKPVAPLFSTPAEPGRSTARQTTVLPTTEADHPPTAASPEERQAARNEGSKRKGPPHAESSR